MMSFWKKKTNGANGAAGGISGRGRFTRVIGAVRLPLSKGIEFKLTPLSLIYSGTGGLIAVAAWGCAAAHGRSAAGTILLFASALVPPLMLRLLALLERRWAASRDLAPKNRRRFFEIAGASVLAGDLSGAAAAVALGLCLALSLLGVGGTMVAGAAAAGMMCGLAACIFQNGICLLLEAGKVLEQLKGSHIEL